MNTIFDLIERATSKELNPRVAEYAKIHGIKIGEGENETPQAEVLSHLEDAENYLYALMTGRNLEGEEFEVPAISFNEAHHSNDASLLFPRVFSQVLIEPREPSLVMTNNFVETTRFADDSPLFVSFPSMGILNAAVIGEGKEYPRQEANFAEHMASIKIQKVGVAVDLNEEVLATSQWPLIRIYARLLSNAIDRFAESTAFSIMTNEAWEVFNNEDADTAYHTNGKNAAQAWNASLTILDVFKMAGVVINNRYEPSHFLAHPLAWPIFAQDPIIRATFFHQGQLGQTIWTQLPKWDQSMNFPFGIAYTPYYALPFEESDTLTGAGSGLAAVPVTDVYMLDARNALWQATRGDTQMSEMDDWYKDATTMKARKYFGMAAKDGGRGMTVAKNIRLEQNDAPLFTARTVQVSA